MIDYWMVDKYKVGTESKLNLKSRSRYIYSRLLVLNQLQTVEYGLCWIKNLV
jgi:hypothetical protein